MNRIRGGATVAGLALLAASSAAHAQETTGRVTGRVVNQVNGMPLGGVTVIVQGPQGEDATITDDHGEYLFTNLPVGTYAIRFYLANASAQVEQTGVRVSAESTLRVNAKITAAAQTAAQQTTVITGKAPAVDVGSARIGYTFDQDYTLKVPVGRTFGDVIEKAPGVFFDQTGNVSIGGATGLENQYMINGLNVTGMDVGNLESGAGGPGSLGGGTNLPVEFLSQIDVNSGGYQAEFGGGMGGVINTVLKSGSNEFHGSVSGYYSPFWIAGQPNIARKEGGTLASQRRPDFDTNIVAEVGGPLIKDKLFFWVGFAPRFVDSHVFRLTYALQDANGDGMADVGANGHALVREDSAWRARLNESRQTYSYAATVDYIVRPEHRLTLNIFGTPSFNKQMRSFNHLEANANPDWAMEQLNKSNTDVTAHWVSKFFDRHWQIDVNAGLHREDFSDQSPNSVYNARNQVELWGTNLYDVEHAPGCEPGAMGFQPCPIDNYHLGGFGLIKSYTGQRWMGEVKSTHLLEAGGHHEIKYGWRLELGTFDQDRYYSGPVGSRATEIVSPNGGNPNGFGDPYFNTYSFFTLQKGEYPTDYGTANKPFTDLLRRPQYQDDLRANVKSLSNAFFLQDSYSPQGLRNLTINVGARLELQKMYDFHGASFLSTDNLGPRVSAVYDPMNDGRSRVSVSYGRFYESIPMNMAARYFGGEGILIRNGVPLSSCKQPNGVAWNGSAEWTNCFLPQKGAADMTLPGGGANPFNNGSNYPVQSHLSGQFHNEVVATVERELIEDLTLRLDYQHRWLGAILEDGTADQTGSFAFVLANPGNVPKEALTDAQNELNAASKLDQTDPKNASATAAAAAKLANLQGLAAAPKPERTYDALTLSLNKRFSRSWFARGSYTYSRLIGNYEGLYQSEADYFAPNGNNAYDTPDLYVNQRGRLPNDRPHQARLDGYYTVPIGKGTFTGGLGFSARSGMPKNYVSSWYFNSPQNQLLPRGSAGRTPPITQFDLKLAYGRPLTRTVNMEAFIDLFNILNQKTTTVTDDVYTYDPTAAIVNGTKDDLKFAKNVFGAPVTKNPNFGNALAYQAPFSGRLGLRLTF